ncbi:mucin-like protein [Moniliophthora roreri]|nr:mucin-like protein [Moniliophthora roreri]
MAPTHSFSPSGIWYRRGTSEKTQTTAPNLFQHTANSKSPGHVVRVTLLASVRAEDLESGQRVLATLVGKVGVWDLETRSFGTHDQTKTDA